AASAAPYAQAPAVRATNDAMSRRPPYQRGTTALSGRTPGRSDASIDGGRPPAIGVNAVHLKTRLGDVETDCLNCLHVWLLSIVGALTAPTFMALARRWRSRPQHQKRTFCITVAMSALGRYC